MTERARQIATVEVAHEARTRRWTVRDDDGGPVLDTASFLDGDLGERRGIRVASGQTLRIVALVGRGARLEQAARRAALASAAELALLLRADDGRSFGERAGLLREARPAAVLVIAGDAGDADALAELCESLRAGCGLQAPGPHVVLAGESRAVVRLRDALVGFPVEVLPDPRRPEGLAAFLWWAREQRRGTDGTLILRDEALEDLARALARVAQAPVCVADVAGESTSLVRAEPDGALTVAHTVPLGSGRGADRIVARGGLDGVRRWIPWAMDAPTLLERVFNRARWPDAVPVDVAALALEIALAHEALAHALADAATAGLPVAALRSAPLVALTGRVALLPRPAQSLLVAADALQPTVVATVVRDRDDGLIALGAIAALDLRAVEGECEARRETLGVVAPVQPGGRATVRVVQASGRIEERVERGAFFIIPARGAVELSAAGASLRGRGDAGVLGVVIDARGRPLALPQRDAERIPTVARWFAALDALPEGPPRSARTTGKQGQGPLGAERPESEREHRG